jgi:hypothetical protein
MDWTALAKRPCGHGDEPSSSIKCWDILSIYTTGNFSRRVQLQGVISVFASVNGFKNYYSSKNPEHLWHLTLHPVDL